MTDTPNLFAQLKALAENLSVDQKALLLAILKVAGDTTEGQQRPGEPAFRPDFEDAFTPYPPETVALVLQYAASSPAPAAPDDDTVVHAAMMASSVDSTLPAMVVRFSPPAAHHDDND